MWRNLKRQPKEVSVKERLKRQASTTYNPNLGFIGNVEVRVANYIFSAKRARKAYRHSEPLAKRILNKEVKQHYRESKKLTEFLKNRDLTFSKKTNQGYKTFTVPCTTTVVPLQKSIFNDVEKASQRLMISLRKVLQDIYGNTSPEQSSFIASLPSDVREVFLDSIKTSPSYFPQLHHPNMKDYPFLDNVGLDLVLVDDYVQKSESFPKLVVSREVEKLPKLPFKILELNAGSPSGASNNMNMIEGIYSQNPEILDSLGKVMPNDHFKILGETYKSLGENWTGRTDGIQIVLPPGGANGAAPEIHQLAAYSGLVYADADQLFQDERGYIRLRTVNEDNPVVTAIYSRVNSDSALFDPEKDLYLRDPETGEPIYLRDSLRLDKKGKAEVVLDSEEKPIYLQSAYAIPGAIDAIVNRKLYMGGLNRILDNKIILATLTYYAPKFFAKEIQKMGVDPMGVSIDPPRTLPPKMESVEIIKDCPEEWVVKAPSLAGGQGVYILKTLSAKDRKKVIKMIEKSPENYAYQQLVKIGRIPVAMKKKGNEYKFANLAADIRMWVFFGGGKNELPRVSHNALVRYAPQEKGKMSSIVNTSAGGGYAPFVIVDDTKDKASISPKELASPQEPKKLPCSLPVFVGAQLTQVARLLKKSHDLLQESELNSQELLELLLTMKVQLKEVLSYLHPKSIVNIYKAIEILEKKQPLKEIAQYNHIINCSQTEIVRLLQKVDSHFFAKEFREVLDNLRVLDTAKVYSSYSIEEKSLDYVLIETLRESVKELVSGKEKRTYQNILKRVEDCVLLEMPNNIIKSEKTRTILIECLESFCKEATQRIRKSEVNREFVSMLSLTPDIEDLKFETLYLGKQDVNKPIRIATQYEMRNAESLVESNYIDRDLKIARAQWQSTIIKSQKLVADKRASFISRERRKHFSRHPRIKRFQELINSSNLSKEQLIELLPAAPYAKFNLEMFAKEQGLTLEGVFTYDFAPDRLSILSSEQLKKLKLGAKDYAGECFAKKKRSHGLLSQSDIFIWMRKELNPFTLLYTAGHELIHYQQIRECIDSERKAIKEGGLAFAKSLNYYGNFLGSNNRSIESLQFEVGASRKPLYGFVDKLMSNFNSTVVRELKMALRKGNQHWDQKLEEFGSILNYMTPTAASTKVKSLQEVLPALENAKNILFAQELGLEIGMDAVKAAMPSASVNQVEQYRELILGAAKSPNIDWEALRVIASHQYHGVSFPRADREINNLSLKSSIGLVAMGESYNQTQQ